jgi:spheroidene monooxygenase
MYCQVILTLADSLSARRGASPGAVAPPSRAGRAPAGAAPAGAAGRPATGVLVLADLPRGSRWWGFRQFLRWRDALGVVPGLTFGRALGSGHDGGFGLKPSVSSFGLFCAFADDASARGFCESAPALLALRERAQAFFCVRLAAWSSRGAWSAAQPFAGAAGAAGAGPVATLTRASIRLGAAPRFWRHAPAAQGALAGATGCLLAVGLGEAPLLRQATFSIWSSVAALDAYARSGAHLAAARAAAREGYFVESMFTRFTPYGALGAWKGCDAARLPAALAMTGSP